jgi:hypothetical protein
LRTRAQEKSDKLIGAVLSCKKLLRVSSLQLDEGRLALQETEGVSTELHGNLETDGSNIIKLNVGGVRIACRRATLTYFSNSKLAVLFSGRDVSS